MALAFESKPVATIKAKVSGSSEIISFGGVTTGTTTPANAAEQINKILAIAGKAIVADANMKRVITEEAVDNG